MVEYLTIFWFFIYFYLIFIFILQADYPLATRHTHVQTFRFSDHENQWVSKSNWREMEPKLQLLNQGVEDTMCRIFHVEHEFEEAIKEVWIFSIVTHFHLNADQRPPSTKLFLLKMWQLEKFNSVKLPVSNVLNKYVILFPFR